MPIIRQKYGTDEKFCCVELESFSKDWKKAGLTDEDLRLLEITVAITPEIGDVISGTESLRKIRIAMPGRGKRGGARVIYVNVPKYAYTVFLYFYPKNKDPDLSDELKLKLSKLVKQLEEQIRNNFFRKKGKKNDK
ncbi:MAG: type II toxin-antitoxin system RelE/ParE family toxin [Oligoflexales bacterium]|nr:type II toxin-antitoxin system RelE/ParE family toxin [Oligoflexales bacterium]